MLSACLSSACRHQRILALSSASARASASLRDSPDIVLRLCPELDPDRAPTPMALDLDFVDLAEWDLDGRNRERQRRRFVIDRRSVGMHRMNEAEQNPRQSSAFDRELALFSHSYVSTVIAVSALRVGRSQLERARSLSSQKATGFRLASASPFADANARR